MRYAILLLTAVFFTASCQSAETTTASADAKRYPIKGKVISVDRDKKKAKIDHEEIPGFMEAMTMDFPIHEDWVWEDLTPGSEIRAELVVDSSADEPYWLEKIGIIANAQPGQPVPPVNENFAQIGKEVPDFRLTNQDGKPISITNFRGKALAVTFIYSQCPLPEYCIKMSTAFSDAAKQIAADPDAREKIRLLSVSFDPERDTPEKLRQYGVGYLGKDTQPNFDIWQLAVGSDKEVRSIADFFGLRYEVDPNDETQFAHSLRTAVIGPDGKVTKIFAGNEWATSQLITELKSSLGQ